MIEKYQIDTRSGTKYILVIDGDDRCFITRFSEEPIRNASTYKPEPDKFLIGVEITAAYTYFYFGNHMHFDTDQIKGIRTSPIECITRIS